MHINMYIHIYVFIYTHKVPTNSLLTFCRDEASNGLCHSAGRGCGRGRTKRDAITMDYQKIWCGRVEHKICVTTKSISKKNL